MKTMVLGGAIAALSVLASAQTITPADQEALMQHVLTMANVKKVFAIDRDLLQLANGNPAIAQKAAQLKPTSLDAAASAMNDVPEVAALLKKHGFTARDYLLNMITMATTQATYGFTGGKTAEMPAGALRTNVEFWSANLAALKPSLDEWQKTRADLLKHIQK
jgi:hypothetical protein